jgi:hypothetical protein
VGNVSLPSARSKDQASNQLEAKTITELEINFYQTKRRHIPEDGTLQDD